MRRSVLGLAAAAPLLASAALMLYLATVDVVQAVKLDLWRRLVGLVLLAWLIYLADLALTDRRSRGTKLLWALGLLVAWPLAMPIYLFHKEPHLSPLSRSGDTPSTTDAPRGGAARHDRASAEAERIRAAVDELAARGIGRSSSAPPLYRLAWRWGWHVPPPCFQTVREIVRLQGLAIAAAIVLMAWVPLIFASASTSLPGVVFVATCFVILPLVGSVVGLAGALAGALYSRHQRRQLQLPLWADYDPH